MANYITDDFNRADNTSSLGSPTSGGPYTVRVGTWGINTNRAYVSASLTNSHVTFPAVVDVDLQVTFSVVGAVGSAGLIFRWVDASNYWMAYNASTWWALTHRSGGANSTVVMSAVPATSGDTVRVITKGVRVYLFVNGTLVAQVEDQWIAAATSTCGLAIPTGTTTRIDNLTANDAPTLIPGGIDGASAEITYEQTGSTVDLSGLVYKGRDTATADAPTGVA